jgi:protein O-GlcNAc transferase
MASMTLQQAWQASVRAYNLGDFATAESICRRVLAAQPSHVESLNLLSMLADRAGHSDESFRLIHQAIAAAPNQPALHFNLGTYLKKQNRLSEAIDAYRKALALKGEYVEPLYNLAIALWETGETDESISCYQKVVALRPDLAEARNNLGNVWKEVGEFDKAIDAYRQAIRIKPDFAAAWSNLLYSVHFHAEYDNTAIRAEHVRWQRDQAEPLKKLIRPHQNDRNPDRRLRVGYISPDFRDHCQSLFTMPLFAHHDKKQFEIFCYTNSAQTDAVTVRLRGYADHWRDVYQRNDDQVADLIRQDEIDILVDLTLHMAHNRLLVFARKPAPIQVTWLGYPGSTGLDTIDYRLTDPYLDPPGQNDSFYSEKSVRLPATFWCYQPSALDGETPPEVGPLPARSNGHVTFGCLNNFTKINQRVIEAWNRILDAVPDSRLLLLAPRGSHRAKITAILGQRVEFTDKLPRRDYLRTYDRIDIGLDTFPCNGHTTTMDALWMGVSVVTLPCSTAISRGGTSILGNVGLPELIAHSSDEYIQLAVNLAKGLSLLDRTRSELRARMRNSPLMDAQQFAANMEGTYRQIWREWAIGA